MANAQCAQRCEVDNLRHSVGICQMEDLRMQKVIAIEHHLGEKPVILIVKWGISEIGSDIGLDGKGQEVTGPRVEVKVGITGCSITTGLELVASLIRMTCKEKPARFVQAVLVEYQHYASKPLCRT